MASVLSFRIALIVRFNASLTSEHGGLPVADNVIEIVPVSPGPGIYVGEKVDVFIKLPVPFSLQENVRLFETEAPDKVYVEPEQIVASFPAIATGDGLIVSNIKSVTTGQGRTLETESVKVTTPVSPVAVV